MVNPANYYDMGLTNLEEGDYDAAIAALTKALRLSLGDLGEVLLARGEAYAYKGDTQRAMADFNEALRQNPYLAEAYNERGNLRRFLGDYEGAISDQTAAIQLDPGNHSFYYNRAMAFEAVEQYELAEADLTKLIELDPGIAPAYEGRARMRSQRGDYRGAIRDLQRYLRMGGGHQYDNHSEVQSLIISLRIRQLLGMLMLRF